MVSAGVTVGIALGILNRKLSGKCNNPGCKTVFLSPGGNTGLAVFRFVAAAGVGRPVWVLPQDIG